EVSARGVVAVEVEQDPAAGEQPVLVVAEHGARGSAEHRSAEAEESKFDAAIPELWSERSERRRSARRRSPEEQDVEIALDVGQAHRRDATELEVHRFVAARADRIDSAWVDVDHRRSVAD